MTADNSDSTYGFLLDTYEIETLKVTGIWQAFPDSMMNYKPHPKSRSRRVPMLREAVLGS
jgi:hypothetical protein